MSRVCPPPAAPRGFTLIGLLAWAMLVGFAGYVLVRTVPTVFEFYTFQRAVDKIAAAPPATVGEIRRAFDRQKEVDYTSNAVTGNDLEISKENDRVVIGFSYEKEIELMGPVYLLIKYHGRSR
jgi:hypothetical protein